MNRAPSSVPAFVADATLGKLGRYLRLAGFDSLLDTRRPDARHLAALAGGRRIVLTRSVQVKQSLLSPRLIFIEHNHPREQIRQVMAVLDLHRRDLNPMTRCAECNCLLEILPKSDVLGRVPEYIFQNQTRFYGCRRCKRVYWAGSHARRWLERMEAWFEQKTESI